MPFDRKTAIWTGHHPSGPGKRQIMAPCRATTDLAGFLPPNSVMTMMRPDKRMGNFMQNRITNMICIGVPNIQPRQRNSLVCVITLASPPARMVKLDPPPYQPVRLHQFSRKINRHTKWPRYRRFLGQGGPGSGGRGHRLVMPACPLRKNCCRRDVNIYLLSCAASQPTTFPANGIHANPANA